MTIKEIYFPENSPQFVPIEEISQWHEYAVSPSLPGTLYDINRLVDQSGNTFAVKTLLQSVNQNGKYPATYSLEEIFHRHQYEHQLFLNHMSEFVVPTCFYIDESESGTKYRVIQPWINYGIQYKEAIKSGREIPTTQMPYVDERMRFIEQFNSLLRDRAVSPRIADVDFFLAPHNGNTTIRLIDTNFLWHPKHHSDGRMIHYQMSTFLFSKEERTQLSIKILLAELEKALHIYQL